jgi:hypothetical protein
VKEPFLSMTPDMAVVTPLNNLMMITSKFLGPEGDTVTVDKQLLNTHMNTEY